MQTEQAPVKDLPCAAGGSYPYNQKHICQSQAVGLRQPNEYCYRKRKASYLFG